MLKRILLPTDGSELSERALAIAATIAAAQGAEVVLACVVWPPWWTATDHTTYEYSSPELYEQIIEAMEVDARAALDRLSQDLAERNVRTRTILLKGSPALELLALEERERPDLVVMATHGRTGLARFALGSVADRLVREGISPVLVVRSFSPAVGRIERVLVALDGSSLAEEALNMVEALAGKPLRLVKLLRVVGSDIDLASASAYMSSIALRMENAGLEAVQAIRVDDDPARVIESEAQSVDLVVLATHGRGGFDRLRHGSVAERAIRYLTVPALLVRAGATADLDAEAGEVGPKPVSQPEALSAG
jgi:nucleotide-binding universal stress UspA family protein